MQCFELTTRVRAWFLLSVILSLVACTGSSPGTSDPGKTDPLTSDSDAALTMASDAQSSTSAFETYSLQADLLAPDYAYALPPKTPNLVTASTPDLAVSASLGQLDFNWNTADTSHTVRLIQTNFITREFLPLFATQDNLVNTWSYKVDTPLFDWAQTRFTLEVCDAEQCQYSHSIASKDYQSAVVGKLTPADQITGDRFGSAMAITPDASVLAVGAPAGAQTGQNSRGSVAVHFRVDEQWWADTRLQADGISLDSQLGHSVSISDDGDTIVAGAPQNLLNNNTAGAAIVFERFGEGWSQTATLYPDLNANGAFGKTVKVSGDGEKLVISSPDASGDGVSLVGAVSIFQRASNHWQLTQTIKPNGALPGSHFGNAIALSADSNTLFITDKQDIGHVHVYSLIGGQYTLLQSLGLTAPDYSEEFAQAISTNATGTLLIASLRSSQPLNALAPQRIQSQSYRSQYAAQHAAIFSRESNLEWQLRQKLTPAGAELEAAQITVANSADADVISVGLSTPSGTANSVTTFINSSRQPDVQYWRSRTSLVNPVSEANGFAASQSMSADGKTLLIGAPQLGENGLVDAGGVFYY